MSATIFLAICILGCDLLLYFLFQWTYGEKRRGLSRRSTSTHRNAHPQRSQPLEFVPRRPRPFVTSPSRPKGVVASHAQFEGARRAYQNERLAYRRIAASYAAKH